MENNENLIFLCPDSHCFKVPEIIYLNTPFNPIIKYKCNSKVHHFIEEVKPLNEFLNKISKSLICSYCTDKIINNEVFYCKNCKNIFHCSCLTYSPCFKQNNYMSININNLLIFLIQRT